MLKRKKDLIRFILIYVSSQARPDLGELWLNAIAFSCLSHTLELGGGDSICILILLNLDRLIQYLLNCYGVTSWSLDANMERWGDRQISDRLIKIQL